MLLSNIGYVPCAIQYTLGYMYVCVSFLSRIQLFMTPWTIAHLAPLSVEFSRQEYWCGLPFPSPGDLPVPVTEPGSPALQADSLLDAPPGKPVVVHSISCAQSFSYVWLSATPWTVSHQAPLSMEFPGKNPGVGCHFWLQQYILVAYLFYMS